MSISENIDKTRHTKEEIAGKGTGDEHVKIEGKVAEKALKALKEKKQKEEDTAQDRS